LTIHIRPYTYKEVTDASLKTFEQQRIISIVNDEDMPDEVKVQKFNESFVKLTELTVDTMAKCVWKITTPDGDTTDLTDIVEFIHNSPKEVFQKIADHIGEIKSRMSMGNQEVACNECEREFSMPIELDQSSFFGNRS
jgi:hypothetical protein